MVEASGHDRQGEEGTLSNAERPDRESIDQLDRLLLQQALEGYRASASSFATTETAFVIVLVTLLGLAVGRQSWGLSLVSALVYPIIWLRVDVHKRRSDALLAAAQKLEDRLRRGRKVDPGVVKALSDSTKWLTYLVFVIWIVAAVHLLVVVGLVMWADEWTFTGAGD